MAAFALALGLLVSATVTVHAGKPHIVLIVSDDLGWNDVSFHGSTQIGTPHIDTIAEEGVALYNYHIQPVCSPTRATILSGRHVIHTGIYMPFAQGTALRLHLNYTLLPKYLKGLGYSTHMVGKWHLGQNVMASIPTGRGFDTYFGYWSGAEDYYTHDCRGAYDLAESTAKSAAGPQVAKTAFEYNNTYSTYPFTAHAVSVIEDLKADTPLFLYMPYQNVHWPLEAPQEFLDMFSEVPDNARQHVCAMAKILDEGVGNITAALKSKGIYDETIQIFSSDNGGPTNHNEGTFSDNFPMRGGKNTIWEGGNRLVGAIRGPGIKQRKYEFGLMHGADWMPSLLSHVVGTTDGWKTLIPKDEPAYELGDGMDVWEMISTGAPSPRTEAIIETHPEDAPEGDLTHGHALIVWPMKIIKVHMQNNEPGWYPPPGEDATTTKYTLTEMGLCPYPPPAVASWAPCNVSFCLFNVSADPCEHHNLAEEPGMAAVVEKMTTRLKAYQATAVPPVKPEGCQPVIDKQDAWRPCDSPEVLEDGYNVERTDQFHRARSTQSPYALAGTDSEGNRFAKGEL